MTGSSLGKIGDPKNDCAVSVDAPEICLIFCCRLQLQHIRSRAGHELCFDRITSPKVVVKDLLHDQYSGRTAIDVGADCDATTVEIVGNFIRIKNDDGHALSPRSVVSAALSARRPTLNR